MEESYKIPLLLERRILLELDIDKIYYSHISKLRADVEKFKKAQENPLFIIKELFDPEEHQPFYSSLIKLIKSSGVKHHDIQEYLADKLINYLQSLDNKVEVKLEYPNSYPARFSIKYLDREVLSFNIYTHVFGKVGKLDSIEVIEQDIKSDMNRIVKVNERINKYERYKENLFRALKKDNYHSTGLKLMMIRFRDLFYILFKSKRLKNNISKMIEKMENEIDDLEKNIDRRDKRLRELKQKEIPLRDKYHEWRERFISWGYEELPKGDNGLY